MAFPSPLLSHYRGEKQKGLDDPFITRVNSVPTFSLLWSVSLGQPKSSLLSRLPSYSRKVR